MSLNTRRTSLLRMMPALILVAFVTVGLGAGYYFAAASTPSFAVSWSVRPLNIRFQISHGFSGSAQDSFTCSSTISPVTLKAVSNYPAFITLTVSPSSFPSCGSTPDNITVTASCTPAHMDSSCDGDQYTGTVTVCGPTPYTCVKQALAVNIAVQSK